MPEATRPIYWHITGVWVMYALLVPTLAVFAYGLKRRYRLWRLGGAEARLDRIPERLRLVWTYVLGHRRLLREAVAGWMHAALFWSMVLLFLGTVVVMIHQDLRLPIMNGWFYLVFQSLVLDVVGAFGVAAFAVALIRRYVVRVRRLQHNREGVPPDRSDGISLVALLLIFLQGFALEGIRIAANPQPWDGWSPVGYALGLALRGLGEPALIGAYQFTWWFHLVTVFAWIAYLPYSKMLHVFTGALNVFFSDLGPRAALLQPIDFEKAERLGASAITDFSWKDLLDLDACTNCGRCQEACPAYNSGQPLSPKNLILDLRDYLHRYGPALVLAGAGGGRLPDPETLAARGLELPALVGETIRDETLWACTTCRACMEECPVHIEHVPKILEMRRHLTMEEARVPETLQDALRSLEDRFHPYKGTSASRTDWCEGLDVPVAAEAGEFDVLYWVGCAAAFDPRGQKIARAFARLLQIAGVKFAILGNEESCSGDPARRMGNEFLFEQIARANIEVLNRYRPKVIVTTCPHCLNTIGTEYRQFGGEFTVKHHTQFLQELVDSGRLRVKPGRLRTERGGAPLVTYHDPCYLGRYAGEYEAPRALIHGTGVGLAEMARSRSKSFCCGAGGAHAWMEESGPGPRVNQIRAREAVETGANVIATACPFCMQMMEDGVKTTAGEDGPAVRDVAELLLEAVESTAPSPR
ncbi:(Fe-S)-binding protein [Caldinitratiruptor microaerophilus]|uniref:Iron-sulfur-binding reductase n=1 Tax=Caldinitratiruptor microaerophilus TaxID=671077 RepID=A0AA35CKP6_9FIRM|nr:(Fe-S)-binding protein [Caldinitratiruptor microaerophilus]BDG61065.1 iron-sulfur-binding reductase [Caldinitratiruptor microaerophilus]